MTPVERAKSDLLRVTADIERARAQITTLTARREKISAYIEMAELYESDESDEAIARVRGGVSGAAVRASVDAIRERGKPIHTRELLDLLSKQSIQIGGKEPVANLSGFLSRSDDLKNSRAHGWGLAEWGAPNDETTFVTLEGDNVTANLSRVIQAPVGKPADDLDDEIPF